MSRIAEAFARAQREGRAAFVPFIMAGDPDAEISAALLAALPAAGADVIELGVAFTDPMADGPSIQAAGLRALKSGQTLSRTLAMVRRFRDDGGGTPIILMGYANPIHRRGFDVFAAEAAAAGVDGLIVVDLPPEEDAPLRVAAAARGVDMIRLATPTTDAARLPTVVKEAAGFIYYVSVAGVTGRKSALRDDVAPAVARIRAASGLPVAVGFGVRTGEQAAAFARCADGVVVGSAIVDALAASVAVVPVGERTAATVLPPVVAFIEELAMATKLARRSPEQA